MLKESGKESISKFLVGNRFHIKLRILKDWGCVILREIDFLLRVCWSIPCLHPSWKVHTWIEICASLNHRKKKETDGSRLIPRKHTETLVLLSDAQKGFYFCQKLIMIFGVTAQWRTWEGMLCTAAFFINFIVTVFVRISREFRVK